MSLDIAVDEFARRGVYGDGAGAVDCAVGDYGLAVEAFRRGGGFIGRDDFLRGHCGRVWRGLILVA